MYLQWAGPPLHNPPPLISPEVGKKNPNNHEMLCLEIRFGINPCVLHGKSNTQRVAGPPWTPEKRDGECTRDTTSRLKPLKKVLSSCLDGCSVNHLLRSSDSYNCQDSVSAFSEVVWQAFEDVFGRGLSAEQRIQAALPLSKGGCRSRITSMTQSAARVVALCSFYSQGHKRIGCPAYAATPDASVTQLVC